MLLLAPLPAASSPFPSSAFSTSPPNALAFAVAERAYAAAARAAAFLAETAPEVDEDEVAAATFSPRRSKSGGSLGPSWPAPAAVNALLTAAADVANALPLPSVSSSGGGGTEKNDVVGADGRRVAATALGLLESAGALSAASGCPLSGEDAVVAKAAVARLERIIGGGGGG